MSSPLAQTDHAVFAAIQRETERQEHNLELIASENYVSEAILEAQGSVLTNKYAEGYPGKRYYGGCEFVDQVETLAIERAKKLFGAEAANVQAHSGSQANMAAYMSVMQVGDTMLSLDLNSGGHLTHGMSLNFSGKLYKVVHYGLDRATERIDFRQVQSLAKEHRPKIMVVDMAHIAGLIATGLHPSPIPVAELVTTTTHKTLRGPRGGMVLAKEPFIKGVNSNIFPGIQGGPLMHVIAGKAVAFLEALQPEFAAYQRQIVANAKALAEALLRGGLRLVSGGTDNHLMLVDLRPKKLTGKVAEAVLGKAAITVNKNMIAFDPEKPMVTSGVRIGTPALTTRGMKEAEMATVAALIVEALDHPTDEAVLARVAGKVHELARSFPLYASRLR